MRTIHRALVVPAALLALASAGPLTATAGASPSNVRSASTATVPVEPPAGVCAPSGIAFSFSDALDKLVVDGTTLGGLSDLAWDPVTGTYASTVDNHGTDPARVWFVKDLAHPQVVGDPLVLRRPDGTAYDGTTADDEALAVLADGRLVVSSEVEPSIRIFGTDGVQQASLPVPHRFRVAPTGQATENATLEGLTVSPDGRQLVASMEGTLSGDVPRAGAPADDRRFLVYRSTASGWRLVKQVGYRVDDGMRIAEVQEYATGRLLVLEAAYDPATGNTVRLYAVTGLGSAADVTGVANLSRRPGLVMRKTLVADVASCPTLGATSPEPQRNPLMDNYEGMTTYPLTGHLYGVSLVSDDNFNPTQVTRVLNLAATLP